MAEEEGRKEREDDSQERVQTKRGLVRWCTTLRSMLLTREMVTEEEMQGLWPGDCGCVGKPTACAECRAEPLWDWMKCHGDLRATQGRLEARPGEREHADVEMLRAAREEPASVALMDRDEVGVREWTARAYPKALGPLMEFAERDWTVQWLVWRKHVLRKAMEADELDPRKTPQPRQLVQKVSAEIAYQLQVLAQAAMQPGPDVDWEAAENLEPRVERMDVFDLARLHTAFMEVNVGRIRLTRALQPPQKPGRDGGGRMTWSVFGAQYARAMKIRPAVFMREVSLAGALAQVQLSAPTLEDELGD